MPAAGMPHRSSLHDAGFYRASNDRRQNPAGRKRSTNSLKVALDSRLNYMDTRNKIISLADVSTTIAKGKWAVMVSRFDPMTVFEAERLAELGKDRKLLAVVLDEDGTLLEASARAALVAALRDVCAVAIASPESWRAMLQQSPAVKVIEDPTSDAARRNAFIEMVLTKQQLR